jgi:hypothetical protein
MEIERLQSMLRELHDELTRSEGVDPETLARLRTLAKEIERSLADQGSQSSAIVESHASGLKELLLKFEAEHPQLSVAAGRVADALAAMGI